MGPIKKFLTAAAFASATLFPSFSQIHNYKISAEIQLGTASFNEDERKLLLSIKIPFATNVLFEYQMVNDSTYVERIGKNKKNNDKNMHAPNFRDFVDFDENIETLKYVKRDSCFWLKEYNATIEKRDIKAKNENRQYDKNAITAIEALEKLVKNELPKPFPVKESTCGIPTISGKKHIQIIVLSDTYNILINSLNENNNILTYNGTIDEYDMGLEGGLNIIGGVNATLKKQYNTVSNLFTENLIKKQNKFDKFINPEFTSDAIEKSPLIINSNPTQKEKYIPEFHTKTYIAKIPINLKVSLKK